MQSCSEAAGKLQLFFGTRIPQREPRKTSIINTSRQQHREDCDRSGSGSGRSSSTGSRSGSGTHQAFGWTAFVKERGCQK